MLRKYIFILIILPFMLCAKDLSKLYSELDDAVVIIYSDTEQIRAEKNKLVTKTDSSLGTGTLINKNGLILTAAHVVHSSDELTVAVKNRGNYRAKVLASFKTADIALVKLITNDDDFPFVRIGDSNKAKIGHEVFVIGTPYGLEHTLTVGHLSGRRIQENLNVGKIEFLQTDAAINQGNSGGPLFTSEGELIGVVSFIQSRSGGNEGLGFAASSNMVKEILIEQPIVWFGIEHQLLSPIMAMALNIPQQSGILIERVAHQSFAEELGLKGGILPSIIDDQPIILGGDVIISVGPYIVTGEQQNFINILSYMKTLKGGDNIKFKVLRKGYKLELEATIPKIKIKLL